MKDSVFNPEIQEKHLANKIVAGLERISEVFKVLLWDQAKSVGLSPIQIQILIFIAFHKPEICNVSDLAREFNITKPTVSDATRVLEQKKLIFKDQSTKDRRSYTIYLSESGNKIVNTIGDFTRPLQTQVDQCEKSQLIDVWNTLSKLIYQLNKSGILTVQRTCYGCKYYDPDHNGMNYCNLLKTELHTSDIRLDCPEFEEKGV